MKLMNLSKTEKLLILALFIVLVFCIFKGCDNTVKPIEKIDTKRYESIIDSLKHSKVKIVYLDSIREKVVVKYKTIRTNVNIHDTIQVLEILSLSDTIIATDSLMINELQLSNNLFANALEQKNKENKTLQHQLDSTAKSKRKYFKGFKHGFIAGTVVTGGVLGALIIK